MPILERSCCGCPLAGGSQIIVTFNIVVGILFLLYSFAASGTEDIHGNIRESPGFFSVLAYMFLPAVGAIAVFKKIPVLLIVYVIILWIGIVLLLIGTLYFWYLLASNLDDIPGLYEALIIFLFAYGGGLTYLSLILFSYYQELQHPPRSTGSAVVV